jgi:hypothetical protein
MVDALKERAKHNFDEKYPIAETTYFPQNMFFTAEKLFLFVG